MLLRWGHEKVSEAAGQLFHSVAPIFGFSPMMLNGGDDNYVASHFVDDAVRKSVNLAAAGALR
jgi:hypothetical protein